MVYLLVFNLLIKSCKHYCFLSWKKLILYYFKSRNCFFPLQMMETASRWRWVASWRSCTAPVTSSSRESSRAGCWKLKITSSFSVRHHSCSAVPSNFCHHPLAKHQLWLLPPRRRAVFLSSELQAAQIAQSRRGANAQDSSSGRHELLAMCTTLGLPEAAGQDAAGVLSLVREAVCLTFTDP